MVAITIEAHLNLAIIRVEGAFSIQDLANGVQAVLTTPGVGSTTASFWDFRAANWQRVRDEMQGLADDFRHWLNDQPRTGKTAMLFGSEAERTLLQLFYESGDFHGDWAFFTDEAEARHWLSQA